jgi:hypothetical protein
MAKSPDLSFESCRRSLPGFKAAKAKAASAGQSAVVAKYEQLIAAIVRLHPSLATVDGWQMPASLADAKRSLAGCRAAQARAGATADVVATNAERESRILAAFPELATSARSGASGVDSWLALLGADDSASEPAPVASEPAPAASKPAKRTK